MCEGVGELPVPHFPYLAGDGPPEAIEVGAAVKKMKARGAPGVDSVTGGLLRAGGERVVWWLVRLFREIWETGVVPMEWGLGAVVPVPKKGDPREPGNYRGVTLMVVAAKVLERVILARIRPDREGRCREGQAGFRVGRSCGEQAFVLRRVLEERGEWGLPVVAVALDFSSAYDAVDRESLFRVLAGEGMGPRTLAVVKALCSGTRAVVRVRGEVSSRTWTSPTTCFFWPRRWQMPSVRSTRSLRWVAGWDWS